MDSGPVRSTLVKGSPGATAPVGPRDIAAGEAQAIVPGFVLAIVNPKAFAAIGAVYASQSLFPEALAANTVAKIAALVFVIVIVNTAYLAFGSVFAGLLGHPRLGRIVNVLFALMLLASVGIALMDLTGIERGQ